MVLIFSDPRDNSTSLVLDWLIHMNQPFKVLLTTEPITVHRVEHHSGLIFHFTVPSHPENLSTDMFSAVWYRRNMPPVRLPALSTDSVSDGTIRIALRSYWTMEQETMSMEFMQALTKIPSIGGPFHYTERTLRDLAAFAKVGGTIPKTLISSSKSDLRDFMAGCREGVICKKLNYSFCADTSLGYFAQYTEGLDHSNLGNLPEHFGPTLFQERIPKYVELRIYVLTDQLFAMAIFSQDDSQTATDFRHYNDEKPLRTAPYTLPDDIAVLIRAFMNEISTNTGSIDMVLTPNNEYVFLEINTIGQFGMVSQVCNFQFEKNIAHELRRIAHPDIASA